VTCSAPRQPVDVDRKPSSLVRRSVYTKLRRSCPIQDARSTELRSAHARVELT
jgi:hypothetical protein